VPIVSSPPNCGRITFILRSVSTLNGVGTDGLRML
jgi:hypothetical protein